MHWKHDGARFWGCSPYGTDRQKMGGRGAASLGMLCCGVRVVCCVWLRVYVFWMDGWMGWVRWMDGWGRGGRGGGTADMCSAVQCSGRLDGWTDQCIVLSMVCDAFIHTWIFLVKTVQCTHRPREGVHPTSCSLPMRMRPCHPSHLAIQPLPGLLSSPSIHPSPLVSLLSHCLFFGGR